MGNTAVGIAYVDGPRLRASLLAAADWIDAGKEELDRINVFPVPEGDTGTNFCSTFRAVAEAVRKLGPAPLPAVTKAMAQTCVFSAHGNSGMLLSQFLLGFRDTMGDKETASANDVARAIRRGAERLHLDRRLTPRPNSLSLGVVHAGAKETAASLQTALVARYTPRYCIVEDVTSAIGVHVGPGAWGIFYQIED
jgi:hypothetical protein